MRLLLIMPLLVLLLVPPAMAALQGTDVPNDDGSGLEVSWEVPEGVNPVTVFVLYRRELPEGGEVEVGAVSVGDGHYVDKGVRTGVEFEYRLAGRDDAGEPVALLGGPFSTRAQWFNSAKMNIMLSVILFTLCVLLFIHKANRGESLYLRKIAGLDELDDAVGRATEMGRPVFHVPGIGSVSDVATLASLSIMRRVAKRVAEYNVPFVVPCTDPLVMTTAQEVVKTAYAEAGRPEMFNPDNVSYLTYDQFGYAAGVDGMMLRDKPGAVLLLGYFMAESLILAETGNAIGAIQIAGT
ncbi:fibronectin type III domain-containing protein, partial [bacterium]|nr:fibronectin type III domain-containing protein [candidate division CSSED10-310 bacterium]